MALMDDVRLALERDALLLRLARAMWEWGGREDGIPAEFRPDWERAVVLCGGSVTRTGPAGEDEPRARVAWPAGMP